MSERSFGSCKVICRRSAKGKSGVSLQDMVNEFGKESAYGQKRKPLEVAVVNEHVPIILYLLEHGANVEGRGCGNPL